MAITRHITHIKSKVVENGGAKLPAANQIEFGEIAVNYAKGYETLSIKNESGDIVTFKSFAEIDDRYYTKEQLTGSSAVAVAKATSASTAAKLSSNNGSATNPIYFNNGLPSACTYTLGASVPSSAKFSDSATTLNGHYSPTAVTTATKSYTPNSNQVISSITISADSKGHITSLTGASATLGGAAFLNTGETSGTVAAGNHTHSGYASSSDLRWIGGGGTNSAVLSGGSNTASGNYSVAEGYTTTAATEYTHAEGIQTYAYGLAAHAEGIGTSANNYSHSEGQYTLASGDFSHAEGVSTSGVGIVSHSEGKHTLASGQFSHAEGVNTYAYGLVAHAEGSGTTASGESSHAEGSGTTASGQSSHAEGSFTIASKKSSHAEGYSTSATGYYAHAEGDSTKASANAAHAEGISTKASNTAAHAEGLSTNAIGEYSHAEGASTFANILTSHAEGSGTTANSIASHAEGLYTVTNNIAEHACGKYNSSSNVGDASGKTIFSVGNGTSTSNRNNAFEIKENGDIYISDGVCRLYGVIYQAYTISTDLTNQSPSSSISGATKSGYQNNVIYYNSGSSSVSVSIATTWVGGTIRTPDGQQIVLDVPSGGYSEINYINIGGTIYARGV